MREREEGRETEKRRRHEEEGRRRRRIFFFSPWISELDGKRDLS